MWLCIPSSWRGATRQAEKLHAANVFCLRALLAVVISWRMATLLDDIMAFCEKHEMAPTRFGELAMNDRPFVPRLQAGRRTWPETEAKVRGFMATYSPDQADAA